MGCSVPPPEHTLMGGSEHPIGVLGQNLGCQGGFRPASEVGVGTAQAVEPLQPLHGRHPHVRDEQRVLAKALCAPAEPGVCGDVEHWREPVDRPAGARLQRVALGNEPDQRSVPRCPLPSRHREDGAAWVPARMQHLCRKGHRDLQPGRLQHCGLRSVQLDQVGERAYLHADRSNRRAAERFGQVV